MREIILFLLCFILLDINLTSADFIVCRAERNEDGLKKIDYCDVDGQYCCDTGCCPKNKHLLLICLLLSSALFICCLYNCIKCCRNTDFANDANHRITTFLVPRPLVEPDLRVGTIGVPEFRLTMPPARSISRENGPPPAYDAVFGLNVPLGAGDRLPSYEDVMEGREKNGTVGVVGPCLRKEDQI